MCKTFFGDLYDKTFTRFKILKNRGYNIKYMWEDDWKKFKTNVEKIPSLMDYN